MNVFDILREKLKEIVYHDKHRKTVYLEGVYEIIYQAEQELGNSIICSLGSPCEYQNEDIRVNDNNGWIPCNEKLPEVTQSYGYNQGSEPLWVTFKSIFDETVHTASNAAVYLGEGKWKWFDETDDLSNMEDVVCEIVAWRPLAEPYNDISHQSKIFTEEEQALIDGVELARDWQLPIPPEDYAKYLELTENRDVGEK